jgi:hypothetical protein
MNRLFRFVLVAGLVGSAACSGDLVSGQSEIPVSCTANFVYGVRVTVTDSTNGLAPTSIAKVVVRDVNGTYADSGQTNTTFNMYLGAGERAGTYRVSVTAPGYRDWSVSPITVTRNTCHVNPVGLTAVLQRLAP